VRARLPRAELADPCVRDTDNHAEIFDPARAGDAAARLAMQERLEWARDRR